MKNRARVLAVAVAVGWAWPALADYQAGADAYYAKNFAAAMAEWLPLAEAGDPVAQNSVGALYDHGLGVEENDAEAAVWYRKAAENGLPLAMRNLGEKYLTGHGVPYDRAQAEEWLRKAASLGDSVAMERLSIAIGAPQTAPPDPQRTAIFSSGLGTGQQAEQGSQSPPQLQQASVSAPSSSAQGAWIFGQWQGPALGCPPNGGLEFAPDRVLSYYSGRISSKLAAQYRGDSDAVNVDTIGVDGKPQTYQYRRIDNSHFEIAKIPQSMPDSMIGVRFERCGAAPAIQQAQAPTSTGATVAGASAAPSASADFGASLDPATEFQSTSVSSKPPEPQEASSPAPAASSSSQQPTTIVTAPEPAPAQSSPTMTEAAPLASANEQPAMQATQPVTVASAATSKTAQNQPANALQAGWQAFGKGDTPTAIALWKPEAEAGNVAMQLLIGSIYDYGQGVPQDDAEAIKWYRKAAASGSAKGKFLIGAVYARSSQIQDSVKGLAWLKAARRTMAQSGKDADGEIRAQQVEVLAKQIAAGMSASQIAEADRLASTL